MRRLAIVGILATLSTGCHAVQSAGATGKETVKLISHGDDRELRKRPDHSPPRSADKPELLVLALDGVDRKTLYELIDKGEMPQLARLLGPNVHKETKLLSTLPSTTMPAWTTAMTGLTPAEHGVTGNEYFIRESKTFACPAPVSFTSAAPTIAIFTDSYLDALHAGPTVYERMREKDPDLLAWVAMHFIHRGADQLLLAKRSVFAEAFKSFVESSTHKMVEDKESRVNYATLDNAVAGVVVDHLEKGPVPDVLTVYFSGTDLFAHVANEGPNKARAAYLKEVLDPQIGRIAAKLRERGALDKRRQ
jgi:predicted AlkP superfamily pyrophosphatase or phosphodiesterase